MMPSLAVFCPQSKAPTEKYLNQLRFFLTQEPLLQPFVQDILDLEDAWAVVAEAREDIAALSQGPKYLRSLGEWIRTGNSSEVTKTLSGILSLPLLVATQLGQYLQYLNICGMRHTEFLHQLETTGGIQGYCGGLPTAVAIACAKDEGEVVKYTANAMRIAMAIGAFGELGDDPIPGVTTIVVRLKREGDADALVEKFSRCYISAITDPKTVSIVGPVKELAQLKRNAQEQGFLCQELHIRGKVHNPENRELAKELCDICEKNELFRLPTAQDLRVPVRSNLDGKLLSTGSLSAELVNTILAAKCEWWQLLNGVAVDLQRTGSRSHQFVTFGIGDCTPLAPFHNLQLQISKLDVLSFIDASIRKASSAADQYSFPSDAVAIIGASCRLPGANNLDELWAMMSEGMSRHVEVPKERINIQDSFRASQDRKFSSKRRFYGNFVEDIDRFDHAFFRTSPKEAINMDPQQRILLELAYEAMESSGYMGLHRREAGDPFGCFIGASFTEYLENTSAYPPTAYTSTGTIRAFLSGKISYYFGWSGPSEVIDTACSASLVAVNRACKAIQANECPVALAGGINIMTGITNFLDLGKAGFLSPTGQCKPFDQSADGYCRSDGGGLVVLKLLSKALQEGDQVLGVIPGMATNQGGLSPSLTIPHSAAQVKLYQTVLSQAGMTADQVSYVEAHGTGTQAGDPLEVASVREVFGGPSRPNPLYLGSIKGNIGHCETAAGIAGVLKVLAMIKKRSIPPLASHKTLNPKIPPLEPDRIKIPKRSESWNVSFLASCVNSYGAAGSNAALICTEGPQRPNHQVTSESTVHHAGLSYPIVLSSATQESLNLYANKLRRYLSATNPPVSLGDLAYTLSNRRGRHQQRWLTKASNMASLLEQLAGGISTPSKASSAPKPVILAFGGQSKQIVGLDKTFYNAHPHFQAHVNICNTVAQSIGVPSLLPAIFQTEPISDVVILQCGTFAVQYASAQCWIDAGLKVDAVIGHSFGELTALTVSGILSLEDGMKLIATRASLMQTHWGPERGAMLAVHAARDIVHRLTAQVNSAASSQDEVEIACYNGNSSQVVVSSPTTIERVVETLKQDPNYSHIRCQRVDVTHGFHSRFTETLLDELDKAAASLSFSKPQIPLETCTTEQCNTISANRISQHTREPVYFFEAVQRIEKRYGQCIWLEVGFNSPIISMVKGALATPNQHVLQTMAAKDAQGSSLVLADVVLTLWSEGVSATHWNFIKPTDYGYQQIWLPPYEFQGTRHWLPNLDRVMEAQRNALAVDSTRIEKAEAVKQPRKLVTLKAVGETGTTRSFSIHTDTERFTRIVSGHAVRQRPLCPASMYMECAVMALQILERLDAGRLYFEHFDFMSALGVDPGRQVELILDELNNNSWAVTVRSTVETNRKQSFTIHMKGIIGMSSQPSMETYQRLVTGSITELESKSSAETLMTKRVYGLFSQVVSYDPFLQGISHIKIDNTQAFATIRLPESQLGTLESSAADVCDTVTIDMFIQVVGVLINSSDLVSSNEVYVATGLDHVSTPSMCGFGSCGSWNVYAKYIALTSDQAIGDIFVLTPAGRLVMTLTGARFNKLPMSKLERFLDAANSKLPSEPMQSRGRRPPPSTGTSTPADDSGSDVLPSGTPASSVASLSDLPKTLDSVTHDTKALRSIIASYTGISAKEIAEDTIIGDLGVDSLAAIELIEELQSRFGKEVDTDDLISSSYGELVKQLVSPAPPTNWSSTKVDVIGEPKGVQNDAKAKHETTSQAQVQELYKLLADATGAPLPSLKDTMSLEEIGVDSLSAVELRCDIEDLFSVTIDDDTFTLASTLKEIMSFLNIDPGQAFKQPSTAAATAAATEKTIESSPVSKETSSGGATIQLDIPDPIPILTHNNEFFESAASQRGFSNYLTEVAPHQNKLLLAYIGEAFHAFGVDLQTMVEGEALPEIHYSQKHRRVMHRLFNILEKHGVVMKQGPAYLRGGKALPEQSSRDLHDHFIKRFPSYAGEAALMALTGPKLADCLSGKADPVVLMFRDPAPQKVMENYYTDSPMLSTLTEQIVTFISGIFSRINSSGGCPVEMCEVGAGFGGTTTRLAEMLDQCGVPVKYTFTDIAQMLVKKAKSKFSNYSSWMSFQTFDLESDVPTAMQGQFDIIIGTNCVYATASKTATCARLYQLLRKDGFMVLSEVTGLVDWYDMTFGLLDGWWLAEGGTAYPLQPPESWMQSFREAGFTSFSYSQGLAAESNIQRLLVASKRQVGSLTAIPQLTPIILPKSERNSMVQTVIYKEIDGVKIMADIYLPGHTPPKAMPIALMIHGGGHMTLSRHAIRSAQTSFLLSHGILPISIDYRLCPEINLIDGPIADVRDALAWARAGLSGALDGTGITVDTAKVVIIGWSSGGHLAMTTAWTSSEIGLSPPQAILAFYCPTDFESGDLDVRRAEMYPERRMAIDDILRQLPTKPITNYDGDTVDTSGLGWVRPGDPRSELVLSLFKEGNGLPLMLNGISGWHEPPDPSRVAAISPMGQLRRGRYHVPTFLIHGSLDEIAPFHAAQEFADALQAADVRGGLLAVEGAKHIFDLHLRPGMTKWTEQVLPGYEFLLNELQIK